MPTSLHQQLPQTLLLKLNQLRRQQGVDVVVLAADKLDTDSKKPHPDFSG
jgi:hypothetical protein